MFDGLGDIRRLNISKGGFRFANSLYLIPALETLEKNAGNNVEEIVAKYVEMKILNHQRWVY